MVRSLFQLGAVLLAGAVWVWLAGAVGWLDGDDVDLWAWAFVQAALACVAVTVVLRAVGPLVRSVRGARCARCGAPAARGGVYCLDHTKQALDEIRDRTRASLNSGQNHRI